MARNNREVGNVAEMQVLDRYLSKGYVEVAHSWYGKGGEIDLIVRNDAWLVFCEVKYRSSDAFGAPQASVTYEKQRRIRQTALEWLAQNIGTGYPELRFDVAAVTPSGVTIHEACF